MAESNQAPAPAIPPAAEPAGAPSEHEAPFSLVAQLQARIEAGKPLNPLNLKILQQIAAGEVCRTFEPFETESVLIEIEALLDAMQIIHVSFHNCDGLDGVRRVCGALDPVIAMTVAETAKLRATLFGAED